jgi:PadR family transcriptional regulator, regulatory protein PadR
VSRCVSACPYVRLFHMPEVQVTVAVARLLREFLSDPSADRYGYELMRATSFPSGKLYPILTKLVRIGWLVREREDTNPAETGRPPRFYYRLTAGGVEAARYELAILSEQLAPPICRPGFFQPEAGQA